MPLAEDPGGHDDVRGAGPQPGHCILQIYAAADLHPTWIRAQGGVRFGFVTASEHDDMPPSQPVLLVKPRVPGSLAVRNKIRSQLSRTFRQRRSNDLFNFTFVQIDAWPKHIRAKLILNG